MMYELGSWQERACFDECEEMRALEGVCRSPARQRDDSRLFRIGHVDEANGCCKPLSEAHALRRLNDNGVV